MTAVVVFLTIPLLAFRGRTLRQFLATELGVYAVAAVAWRHVAGVDPYLAAVTLFVLLLALFAIALAVAPGHDVRWSATRAAVIALLVYLLLVPAMTRVPIDGDEPYYLLITESIVHDFDLDLANQYGSLDRSQTRRPDLRPQEGDPTGPRGEQYSRHEPFLPLLLVPGYLIAGLKGSVITMILLAALLARSTVRLLEDEGVQETTIRAMFPLIAFGPPIIFYAARIWPEVPAALCFVEALRGVRQRRAQRWIPALLLLALLKLRFVLVAIPLVIAAVARSRKHLWIGAGIVVLPLVVLWIVSGSATSVHSIQELMPVKPSWYARGLFGLLLDGAAGIVFQAPLYLLGIFAMTRWRDMPGAFRLGSIAVSLYLILLIPRWEWHGGWAPPLRYVVFFTPVLALGAAALWERLPRELLALIGIWTAGLVVHGVAVPWRLFHIANGENAIGEWLSRQYHTDFSRLFPSFLRFNQAAVVGVALLVLSVILSAAKDLRRRDPSPSSRLLMNSRHPEPAQRGEGSQDARVSRSRSFAVSAAQDDVASTGARAVPRVRMTTALVSVLLAAFFVYGQKPGAHVDFEDAHVMHQGGELYPAEYTVSRFLYRGGWIARAGDSLSFLIRPGLHTLHYSAAVPAQIEIAGRPYRLAPTEHLYRGVSVNIARERVELRVISGEVNLDRIE